MMGTTAASPVRLERGTAMVLELLVVCNLAAHTGTPYYASPEVWKDQPYDFKSDVWSLGCVLYEMAALRPPFKANDMNGLYKKVISASYPPIPNRYSAEFKELIAIMLQPNPNLRPIVDEILSHSILINLASQMGDVRTLNVAMHDVQIMKCFEATEALNHS